MDNNRKHSRIKLQAKCALVVNERDAQPASLDDLSFSGALVEVNDDANLSVGDMCQLELTFKTAERPIKRGGKIVRLAANKIGVKFVS